VRKIFRTEQSLRDTLEIWEYIAADNIAAADALVDKLEDRLAMLTASPEAGRARPEFTEGMRSFPIGNYVLFYRPVTDGIQLIRVIHGARDISSDFFSPES